MNKITPHLWFDAQAREAAEFYCSVFPNSKIDSTTTLRNTPSGDTETVAFQINGFGFMAISAGPYFKFNPSISFIVNFDPSRESGARENLDRIWARLSEGGKELMPLGEYPFSKHYGWIQDKYGLSWQLILSDPAGENRPYIVPSLLFAGENTGQAEKAINFYLSVFKTSRLGNISRYPKNNGQDKEGTVMFADFKLGDTWLAAMDSAYPHEFQFNEAISLMVRCRNQEEIDYYWKKLSAVPEAEQCGWLKDKFGVSWQIVPVQMNEMMSIGTPEQINSLTETFLPMKKLEIDKLEAAFNQADRSG